MHIKVAHHLFSDTTFRRGYDYVNWGLVLNKPQQHAHVYEFSVVGTKRYQTSITVDDVGHLLSATCDCHGKRYCKHLAASFILLSQSKKDEYQTQPYLKIPDDFNEYVFDLKKHEKQIIEVCNLALEHAKSDEDSDVLFEAYEFYMDQMQWLSEHHYFDSVLVILEWMMDEFVSYWTSTNNDCYEMDFFDKQTQWLEKLVRDKNTDSKRVIEDVTLWLELYPEIRDSVINKWLILLSEYAKNSERIPLLEGLFERAKECVDDDQHLIEAHYFFSKESMVYFPFEAIDVTKYSKIVRHMVDVAIEKQEYTSALELIFTQVQKQPKYEDIPWVSLWVMICEINDDNESLKSALRWLFYCGETSGYHQLKESVDRRKWKDEVDIMLTQYNEGVFSDWTYRQLLVLERRWDLLKKHVKKHPWFISQLNKHLIDIDPDFVYDTLRQWIISRYKEFKDEQTIKPWIVLFSSYFSEEEGYKLLLELKE